MPKHQICAFVVIGRVLEIEMRPVRVRMSAILAICCPGYNANVSLAAMRNLDGEPAWN